MRQMQIAIFVSLTSVLLFTSAAVAQQNRTSARGQQQYRSSFVRPPARSFRVSMNPRQFASQQVPQSVISSDFQAAGSSASWQPEGNFWVEGGMQGSGSGFETASNFHPAGRSRAEFENRFADSTNKSWGNGFYQNVTGNVFGVSKHECCDEWAGHCACLELTSTHSNCECTNPRRAHWGNGNGRSGSGSGCQSCGPSQSNNSVSDYFHSN